MATPTGFIGTIGYIKGNLMSSSALVDKGYSNETFYPGAENIPDSENDLLGKTPLNVDLIPNMTSVNSPAGTCFADRTTIPLNMSMSNSRTTSNVATYCWKFFNSTVNDINASGKYASETGTEAAITFGYTLDKNQYNNGFFDPGTYKFTTMYGQNGTLGSDSNNLYVCGNVSIQLEDDTWIDVGNVPNNYSPNILPFTSTMTFTTNVKFKAVKFTKLNYSKYVHTRNYYRYGTQLQRVATYTKAKPSYLNKIYVNDTLCTDEVLFAPTSKFYQLLAPKSEQFPLDLTAKNWTYQIKANITDLGNSETYYQMALDIGLAGSGGQGHHGVRAKIQSRNFALGQYQSNASNITLINEAAKARVGVNYLKVDYDRLNKQITASYSLDNKTWVPFSYYVPAKIINLKRAWIWLQHEALTLPVKDIKFAYDGELLLGL